MPDVSDGLTASANQAPDMLYRQQQSKAYLNILLSATLHAKTTRVSWCIAALCTITALHV